MMNMVRAKKAFLRAMISFMILAVMALSSCDNEAEPVDITITGEEAPMPPTTPEIPEPEPQQMPQETGSEAPGSQEPAEAAVDTKEPEAETGDGIRQLCIDDDEGKDYYRKGNTTSIDPATNKTSEKTDFCKAYSEQKVLVEFYCDNNSIIRGEYNCSNGCDGGKCLKMPSDKVQSTVSVPENKTGLYTMAKDDLLFYEDACTISEDAGYDPLHAGTLTITAQGMTKNRVYDSEYKGGNTSKFKTVLEFCEQPMQASGKFLNETYCDKYSRPHQIAIECLYGCENGACRIS